MKKLLALVVLAAIVVVALIVGLGSKKPVLYVYTFSGYFDPDLVKEFEAANQCSVHFDYFETNEEADVKVRQGGSRYDLLTMSSYYVSIWREAGLLEPVDLTLTPNAREVDPEFLKYTADPEMKFSIPYTRTVTGIGYNTKMVAEPKRGWAALNDPSVKGRATMLDDAREALGAALKYLGAQKNDPKGYSLNTTDEAKINEAADLLIEWKKNLAKFAIDEARVGLADNTYVLTQQYNGDVAAIMSEASGKDIDFFVPEEGSSLASDDFVILKGASQPELARKFVNFLLEPKNAARNMNGIMYFMPIPKAMADVDGELANSPAFAISEDLIAKCEVIRNVGEHLPKYIKAWDRVKAAE